MGQAAPGVVEQAQEGSSFRFQTAVQAGRREAELVGDMLWTETPLVETAYHGFANPVQRMVDGLLPVEFFLAEAIDEVEQLRIGIRHRQRERRGCDGDAVHGLVEGDARSDAQLVFGDV